MVDVHTHLLPSIDDGAQSVEESQALLQALHADGVRTVVCTPHFYWGNKTVDGFLAMRNEAAQKLTVPQGVELVLGAEVEFTEIAIDFSEFHKLCLGNTRYILLELPYGSKWHRSLFSNLRFFIRETGLKPIIAHVNRYNAVQKNPSYVSELLSNGCLLQVNADSVLDSKPHDLLDVLFSYGQVHVLGSDCHNVEFRPPYIAAALEKVRKLYGENCVEFLRSNVEDVLQDKRIKVPYVHPVHRFGKFYW